MITLRLKGWEPWGERSPTVDVTFALPRREVNFSSHPTVHNLAKLLWCLTQQEARPGCCLMWSWQVSLLGHTAGWRGVRVGLEGQEEDSQCMEEVMEVPSCPLPSSQTPLLPLLPTASYSVWGKRTTRVWNPILKESRSPCPLWCRGLNFSESAAFVCWLRAQTPEPDRRAQISPVRFPVCVCAFFFPFTCHAIPFKNKFLEEYSMSISNFCL